MKHRAKLFIANILGHQVRRLSKKNDFKVIAISGSIGKTSTKLAIAHILSQRFKVRYQNGNYNDLVSVPLIFFGRSLPSLFNPFAWAWIMLKNEIDLLKDFKYDIVVIELGTDGPGQLKEFGRYVSADIGVLTAIT